MGEEEKHIIKRRFSVVRRSPKHPEVDDRAKEAYYIQIGLIATLVLLIIVSLFSRKIIRDRAPYVPLSYVLQVENIPETVQGQKKRPPKPKIPAVPVEAEVEDLYEEVEYEEIESLDFIDLPDLPFVEFTGAQVAVSPKPIFYKWPDYPESEQKKKHQGIIEVKIKVDENGDVVDHEVVVNTTKSSVLEKLAVQAARQSKFLPARDKKNKPITVWSKTTYTFGTKK